jgi:hypothetical protein
MSKAIPCNPDTKIVSGHPSESSGNVDFGQVAKLYYTIGWGWYLVAGIHCILRRSCSFVSEGCDKLVGRDYHHSTLRWISRKPPDELSILHDRML